MIALRDKYQITDNKEQMIQDNILLTKSFAFTLPIIALHNYLRENKEYTPSKPIIRSGTSIGDNLEEAASSISRTNLLAKKLIYLTRKPKKRSIGFDFCANLAILKLPLFESLHQDLKLLFSTMKTTQEN